MTLTGATFAAIAAAGVTFGAATGISRLASSAMESIARQPEAAKDVRTAMIISAGLIEGVAIICAGACYLACFR